MKVFSDPGTQLVGASRELTNQIQNLDWNQIQDYSHERGFSWKFSPGDGPWYNGVAESLVKTIKTALNAAVGESVLAFSELQTCMSTNVRRVFHWSDPVGNLYATVFWWDCRSPI